MRIGDEYNLLCSEAVVKSGRRTLLNSKTASIAIKAKPGRWHCSKFSVAIRNPENGAVSWTRTVLKENRLRPQIREVHDSGSFKIAGLKRSSNENSNTQIHGQIEVPFNTEVAEKNYLRDRRYPRSLLIFLLRKPLAPHSLPLASVLRPPRIERPCKFFEIRISTNSNKILWKRTLLFLSIYEC